MHDLKANNLIYISVKVKIIFDDNYYNLQFLINVIIIQTKDLLSQA